MQSINEKIYIISGKARNGKDTIANIIKDYYISNNKKAVIIHYATTLKQYAKNIADWDGLEETKPRELLQQLSINVIRKEIDDDFLIKRMIDDIKIYSYYFDIIIVADARTKREIDILKERFDNIYTFRVSRNNFDNGLTEKQKQDITEIDLDDYDKFDYFVSNDKTIEDLKNNIIKIVKEVEYEKTNEQ